VLIISNVAGIMLKNLEEVAYLCFFYLFFVVFVGRENGAKSSQF
jgi:hypothetical protein